MSVVAPGTIPSNPPKAERWVLYRNPYAQERADPSGNKREDESSAAYPASEAESPPMSNRNNNNDEHVTVKIKEESSSAAYPNASGTDETTNSVEADESSDLMEATNEESVKPLLDPSSNKTRGSFEIAEEINIELRLARIKAEARAYALSGTTVAPVLTEEQKKERRKEQRRQSAIRWRKRKREERERLERTKKRKRPPGGPKYRTRLDQHWMEMYKRLVNYKKKYGNACVPGEWKEDPQLRIWVRGQCRDYSESRMSKKRIKLLESIGFVWDRHEEQWMKMYQKLVKYKKKHGSTCVPATWKDDQKLAWWVAQQRSDYSKSKLSQNRMKLLKSIGFVWDPREEQWMEMYQRLVNYKKKYGHTCVPNKWKEDPKLANWVASQRSDYSKAKISHKRTELLKSIGFVWRTAAAGHDRWV